MDCRPQIFGRRADVGLGDRPKQEAVDELFDVQNLAVHRFERVVVLDEGRVLRRIGGRGRASGERGGQQQQNAADGTGGSGGEIGNSHEMDRCFDSLATEGRRIVDNHHCERNRKTLSERMLTGLTATP